jgi:Mrp family chromosome partitioning ATPase
VVKSILRNKVYNVGELREVLNIPILGSIIYTETSDKSSLVIEQDNSRNIVAEQFRSIRTNIGFITEESINTKVILITSSISTEGKSFCSLNLGAVYAISGKKTLVIEGDLRKPGISRNFNISKREMGLSNLLSNSQITVDQVIKDVEYENLMTQERVLMSFMLGMRLT